MKTIKIGSRESALAMAQSKWVISQIKHFYPELEFEIIGIKTKGDMILNTRLDAAGGKGLFIKELEQALIDKKIDMAVHSMKDIPVDIPDSLVISAVSQREDPRDVLITLKRISFNDLQPGTVIGTSSLRREIQILEKRPDLHVKTLRGNVLTRIDKLLNQEYQAIILAAAGLKRLGLEERCEYYFSTEELIPAIGQGVLAIETRKNDTLLEYLRSSIHSQETALVVAAERAFMIKLNGGCTTPIAAHAIIFGERMKISGLLASKPGSRIFRATQEGNKKDAATLGETLADKILEMSNGANI